MGTASNATQQQQQTPQPGRGRPSPAGDPRFLKLGDQYVNLHRVNRIDVAKSSIFSAGGSDRGTPVKPEHLEGLKRYLDAHSVELGEEGARSILPAGGGDGAGP